MISEIDRPQISKERNAVAKKKRIESTMALQNTECSPSVVLTIDRQPFVMESFYSFKFNMHDMYENAIKGGKC